MSHPIHHLELRARGCRLRAVLNGVTVAEIASEGAKLERFTPPVNPYLVGAANLLVCELSPLAPADEGPWSLELALLRFDKGGIVEPGAGARIFAASLGGDAAPPLPTCEELRFDNDRPILEELTSPSTGCDDVEALRDYAMRLRALMRAGEIDGLLGEMEPKVQAYARAYDDDPDRIRASLRAVLGDAFVANGFCADFERAEVILERHSSGQLTALRRPDGRGLIASQIGSDGVMHDILPQVGFDDRCLAILR